METKERVEEQTKKLIALDSNPRNLDQFGLSSSSAPIPIQLTIILLVGYSRGSMQVYFLLDAPFPYILHFFRKSLTFVLGIVMPDFNPICGLCDAHMVHLQLRGCGKGKLNLNPNTTK